MAESVRVDTAALRAAGSHADAVSNSAVPGSAQVEPCAPDFVSVGASTRFSSLVDLAHRYTAMANTMSRQIGVLLDASATTYDTQEATSSSTLSGQGMVAAPGAVPARMAVPAGIPGMAALLSGQGLVAPVGEVPTAPRDIARLIEHGRGGPGPRAWETVETSLRADAQRLDKAADQLKAAITTAEESWISGSADTATTRMRALQTWYHGHATYVRGLADYAKAHLQNFRKAATDIPAFKAVVDGERELHMAQEANQRSRGALKPAVVHAQVKLGQLYQASTSGFTNYTIAQAVPEPQLPAPPPPGSLTDSPNAIPATGPGDAAVGTRTPEPAPSNAPLAPVDQGTGVGEILASSGPTWPPGALDPAAPAGSLVDAFPDTAAAVIPQVVPAIIGGVVGGVGGVLGGLAGTGQRALQGMQQAAAPMMSELGQHLAGGGSPKGGEQPSSPAESPSSGDAKPPSDSDGAVGDTEPAWAPGPLSAPTSAVAAPAIAALPGASAESGGTT